jgi:hypothetical protein
VEAQQHTPDTQFLPYEGQRHGHSFGNYRPIALANTMYKLWTSCVQQVLSEFAEAHRIVSGAQSGFRQRTSRAVPIQMLQMAIEDAELSQQDLYTLQVDYSLVCLQHD